MIDKDKAKEVAEKKPTEEKVSLKKGKDASKQKAKFSGLKVPMSKYAFDEGGAMY